MTEKFETQVNGTCFLTSQRGHLQTFRVEMEPNIRKELNSLLSHDKLASGALAVVQMRFLCSCFSSSDYSIHLNGRLITKICSMWSNTFPFLEILGYLLTSQELKLFGFWNYKINRIALQLQPLHGKCNSSGSDVDSSSRCGS